MTRHLCIVFHSKNITSVTDMLGLYTRVFFLILVDAVYIFMLFITAQKCEYDE